MSLREVEKQWICIYLCTSLTKAWTSWMKGSWPSWLPFEPGVDGLDWVEGRRPPAGDDGEPRRKWRDRLERRVLWKQREGPIHEATFYVLVLVGNIVHFVLYMGSPDLCKRIQKTSDKGKLRQRRCLTSSELSSCFSLCLSRGRMEGSLRHRTAWEIST